MFVEHSFLNMDNSGAIPRVKTLSQPDRGKDSRRTLKVSISIWAKSVGFLTFSG
jgi:hypothetical protein